MFENLKAKRDEIVAGGVAVSAFAASAQHIWTVCRDAGNHELVSALHPAGIDGLIYIGIRAMQKGNKWAGGLAIAYGAGYSLAFNAASYGAFEMPKWALAAVMPLAMFFAFLIVHGGHKVDEVVEKIEERIVEVEKTVHVYPELLPIIPFQPKAIEKPKARKALTNRPTSGGPSLTWDVDKAVAMILADESTDAVCTATGAGVKSVQRTKRIVRALAADKSMDEIITGDVTAGFATKVKNAYGKAMAK